MMILLRGVIIDDHRCLMKMKWISLLLYVGKFSSLATLWPLRVRIGNIAMRRKRELRVRGHFVISITISTRPFQRKLSSKRPFVL